MINEKTIEILEHNQQGFLPLVNYKHWRVAILNYFHIVERMKLYRLERHLLTDEVFVLLKGNATLIYQELNNDKQFLTIKMNQNTVYNVKKNVWHHVFLSKDASILIVENSNTNNQNTEYKNLSDLEISEILSME